MKIGIDISQLVYEGTGVANYTKNLVENLLKIDKENEYVLFFSSLRKKFSISNFKFLNKRQPPDSNFQIKIFKFPPTVLDFLWNRLHIVPIEWLIGKIDVFLSSDWTQPPTIKAKKVTIIHDLAIFHHPESFHPQIIKVQKRRLFWVKKECDLIICDSLATKKDAIQILGIEEKRLRVVYPGGALGIPKILRL